MKLDKLIEFIPKVDIHCHLDGSIRPDTMLDLASNENIKLPAETTDSLSKYIKANEVCASLKEYLEKFNIPIRLMQSYENIYRVTYELIQDAAKQNIRYIEIRFAPLNHIQNGLSLKDVINASLEGIKYGSKKYNVMSNLILCIMRHDSPEKGEYIVRQAENFANCGVAAIDLAGDESFPPEIHKKAFEMAKYFGIHRTVHAGETGNFENITKSIKFLDAERIGHGVYAFKSKHIMDFLAESKIPLEMCITSNINTSAVSSYVSHPIKKYLDAGIAVTVNTDNTTVSDTNIIKEYNCLVKYQHFTSSDIKKTIANGISASFLEDDDKKKLLIELDNFRK